MTPLASVVTTPSPMLCSVICELAFRDIELDAHQAQQAPLVIHLRLGAADDPAPFARRMAHAMQTLENGGLAGDVVADGSLHPRHIVGVHQRAPVRGLADVRLVVAEHRFPARREVDAIVERVEVPEAVVGAVEREIVALLEIAQMRLNLDALESGG